jgi:hypothetical protein
MNSNKKEINNELDLRSCVAIQTIIYIKIMPEELFNRNNIW